MLKSMINARALSWALAPFFSAQTEITEDDPKRSVHVHKDSYRLLRRLNRKGCLNFQLMREYVPTLKGNGIEFSEENTSYLAMTADSRFILYNAQKEMTGYWKIDVQQGHLFLVFDTESGKQKKQTYEITNFSKSCLQLRIHHPLGSVRANLSSTQRRIFSTLLINTLFRNPQTPCLP